MQLNPTIPTGASIRFIDPIPDASWVVWASDQNTIGIAELFAVEVANLCVVVQLSPTNTQVNTDIQEFAFSPDSAELIYASDQDPVGVREIYLLELQNPSVVTKLNAALIDAGEVHLFEVSPANPGVSTPVHLTLAGDDITRFRYFDNGQRMLYVGEQDTLGVNEIFVVDRQVWARPARLTQIF